MQEHKMEMREIETGMHELAEIFCDLGTLVSKQGQMIGEGRLILNDMRLMCPTQL